MIELIFGDSDSEGENLTLGDDGWSISELASRGASLFSNGAAAQSEENTQALTHDPLPNIGGNGNDTQTRSISREANGCKVAGMVRIALGPALVFTLSTATVT